ncbi:MAG: hypothetical protein C0504_18555 [Candidatus Solibacter sp.]|nr:hypothetical protein [Candidatus Solibacter sp.]
MTLLLVVLAFTAGLASAQTINPLSCTATAGTPPLLRAEGLAEEVGQVVITCTGGQPTAVGVAIPTVNIQIYLSANTTLTSRLFTSPVTGASEAMLLIDEPNAISGTPSDTNRVQTLCPAPGNCTRNAVNNIGTGSYIGGSTDKTNVFQALRSTDNSVVWLGVPVDPPGTSGNRVLRITNVRANASQAFIQNTLVPSSVIMYITISGTGALPLNNNFLNVGYIVKGMTFTAGGGNYNQCEPNTYSWSLNFSENFGTAFRNNNPNNATPPNMQWVPGVIYNTESMWSNNNIHVGAGHATQGTRLIARFSNIPANVRLDVSNGASNSDGDIANIVSTHDTNGYLGTVSYVGVTAGTTTVVASANAIGSGMAVWEVVSSNPGAISRLTFTVSVTYSSNPLPGLTDPNNPATVTGNYGPVSTVGVQATSTTAGVPRFKNDPTSAVTFTINPCQTNILFPYAANAAGFDTGFAIANTTDDPYGTPDQQGICSLYYYGLNAPAMDTTAVVAPGKTVSWTLSNGGGIVGGTAGTVKSAAGFIGYVIARCNFQYAHGYAFISDPGVKEWAQGYVALILDQPLGTWSGSWATVSGVNVITLTPPVTRTGVKSESLNQ